MEGEISIKLVEVAVNWKNMSTCLYPLIYSKLIGDTVNQGHKEDSPLENTG